MAEIEGLPRGQVPLGTLPNYLSAYILHRLIFATHSHLSILGKFIHGVASACAVYGHGRRPLWERLDIY